jgi:hypothetical protein
MSVDFSYQMTFDYTSLAPNVADDAKAIAQYIRNFFKQTTAGIIEVGFRLNSIKVRLSPWPV